MAQTVQEIMASNPTTCPPDTTLAEVARTMRDDNIGDVLVVEGNSIIGIVTDRDIVIRGLAEGKDTGSTTVRDIASTDLVLLSPSDSTTDAAKKMREAKVRRLPVVDNDKPVGIVSIGDLAIEMDEHSALADISAAPPNE